MLMEMMAFLDRMNSRVFEGIAIDLPGGECRTFRREEKLPGSRRTSAITNFGPAGAEAVLQRDRREITVGPPIVQPRHQTSVGAGDDDVSPNH